ncbi:MAG TPA: 2-C-methyl-D-erythritol 4-phosphate cytidylyltransferase [Lachnospiraceae bacterium]|nr:2-C-methyl-D-erythritol 4-phosphate cytidylyltransferase [Lachnospiraceae bacterium]
MKDCRFIAIVLAAGQGKRMNSTIAKQYMLLGNYPVLYYSLDAFQKSIVDEIVLVVGEGETIYCQEDIVERYQFSKVKKIVVGGKERYHSVYHALKEIGCYMEEKDCYVLIHDAARPFLTQKIIEDTIGAVRTNKAVVVGMPVKDTIKVADTSNYIVETPKRELVWTIQTPQAFEYNLIRSCYDQFMLEKNIGVTDDAMVVEHIKKIPVKLIEGSYRNIKITSPEDILVGEAFLHSQV